MKEKKQPGLVVRAYHPPNVVYLCSETYPEMVLMSWGYVVQHTWTSRCYTLDAASHRTTHTAWSESCEMFRKGKLVKAERQGLPRPGLPSLDLEYRRFGQTWVCSKTDFSQWWRYSIKPQKIIEFYYWNGQILCYLKCVSINLFM